MYKKWLLFPALLAGCFALAQDKPIAFRGAMIYPVTGSPINNGVLIVHKGKIVSVGPSGTAIPPGTETRDLAGKVIIPGLVDSHSHLAGPEGGDASNSLHPEARVMDAINPTSDGFKKRWQAGSPRSISCRARGIS